MASRRVDIDLPRDVQAPAIGRRCLEDALRGHLRPDAIADAKLVASELITNALRHGEGAIRLRLEMKSGRVRIEVVDEGSGRAPAVRRRPGDSSGGWGLRLVDALSIRWGAFEGTTHVWAELHTDA